MHLIAVKTTKLSKIKLKYFLGSPFCNRFGGRGWVGVFCLVFGWVFFMDFAKLKRELTKKDYVLYWWCLHLCGGDMYRKKEKKKKEIDSVFQHPSSSLH